MKNFGKHFLALVILTGAFSAQAQVRTWAFSKDTVYEWASNGDSVTLVNSGSDSLKFDSIGLELVRPTATVFQVEFQTVLTQSLLHFNQGKIEGNPRKIVVAAGQTSRIFTFRVEDLVVRTAKSSAIVQGDTLVVRMIFMASGGRGRDTLMLKGRQNLPPVALRRSPNKVNSLAPDDRAFDLRGRRQEAIPEGMKAPWAPVVSPRE
ncbi:MAG: hypothetical protein K0Q91_2002 [Fibrobacteria bacterium]|jgi:hypothetical protein|nr:hypothetical protein [Fibrobacteria bacterium]